MYSWVLISIPPNDFGRHCERITLAKGIRYHVHDRTLIDGHRAIVFPD
jgi:formyltetrahydrofolate deformylase